MQNLFTGTVAKVASLIAIVVSGYQFAHGEPGGEKGARGCCCRHGHRRACYQRADLALGNLKVSQSYNLNP